MDTVAAGFIIVPGGVALVFLLVLAYLQTSVRESLVRLWQLAWAAQLLHTLATYFFIAQQSRTALFASDLLHLLMAVALVASSRAVFEDFRIHWSDFVLVAAGAVWAALNVFGSPTGYPFTHVHVNVGVAALQVFAAGRFYRSGRIRDSLGLRLFAGALSCWAVLISLHTVREAAPGWLASTGEWLGPLPQLVVGVSMVVVLFENERRAVQENTLAFASLDVDTRSLLTPADLAPALEKMLDRVLMLIKAHSAMLCTVEEWRGVLPSVQRGYTNEFLATLEQEQIVESLAQLAYRRGGLANLRSIPTLSEPVIFRGTEMSTRIKAVMSAQDITALTAVSLQTRNNVVGVLVLPHHETASYSSGQLRLLLATAMQIGTTLENYVLMHEAQRRTKEYELLTQIGQVVSSRLDPDEVLEAIHRELGRLFDTGTFYIAFQNENELHFAFEVREGIVQPRRTRPLTNALSEFILRTGQPLLIRADVDKTRKRLGLADHSGRMAKCYVGVPIRMNGKVAGVMGALNYEREFVFSQRDVDLLQTAAGQLSVAVENAHLFAEEQKRSRYLAFLNQLSNTAISSQDATQMLSDIVAEIQAHFAFDHIAIGVLDYATKDIEVRAEGGAASGYFGRRIPLGAGIIGRVARSGELTVVQPLAPESPSALLPDARSVACLPLTYGEMLLGVLNVESRTERAFADQDILLLRTVADLLATALHNALVFQKMQQQAITDGLTGIKTRRFFMEAVQSEWKRASRSGRPFSVVLVDLDKFKEVNDAFGHLEGDLVLARVARLLEQKSRQSNVVARYGGDEFIILMPETGEDQARALSERLRVWLEADPMLAEHRVTGSFGVSTFPAHGHSVEEVVRVADTAMYMSKNAGGNRVSTVETTRNSASAMRNSQQLLSFVDGFLQREQTGPEHADELVATLKRLCSPDDRPADYTALTDAILTLSRAAEAREENAIGHGDWVARYATIIARDLGLSSDEIAELSFAATVHDVGKILVPERVLNKAGVLSENEYDRLRMHVLVGANILKSLPDSDRIQACVRHHHEHFDGTGYPDRLSGEKIPLGARIICVADAYVNMMTEHSFAAALTEAQACRELESQSGLKFDGMLVRILSAHVRGERAARSGL